MHLQAVSIVLGASLYLAGNAVQAANADTASKKFRISRAPLAKALADYAQQANVSLVLPHLSFRDGFGRTVLGELTAEEALEKLLRGSAYKFETLPSGAFRVFRKPISSPAKAPKTAVEKTVFTPLPLPIEEILVSTTRRQELLQKLPNALSIFSGTGLQESNIGNTRGLVGKVPAFSSSNRGRGRNKLVIRGLSDGSFSGSTQSLVATYLDYARLNYNAPEPGLALVDVEQIEFLRGPQGTLFGSGALGGLYRIVTRKPDPENIEASITARFDTVRNGDMSYHTNGVLNLPFGVANGAIRMVGYHESQTGYIDNAKLNLENTNDSRTSGGRAMLAVEPWREIKVSLGINYQEHKADDTDYFEGGLGTYNRANGLLEPHEDELLQYVGRIDANIGFADLVSATSWLERDIDSTLDATSAISELAGIDAPAPSPHLQNRRIETLTHETHLASKSGARIEWLIGLFLSRRKSMQQTSITVPDSGALETFGSTDTLYAETLTDEMTETAGFGELVWYLSEKLSVTAGGRWFGYDILARSTLDNVGTEPTTEGAGDQQLTDFTPKFVISYYPNEDTLLYLHGSEGFRVGGINLKGPTALEEAEESEEDEENETPEDEAAEHSLLNFDPDKMFNLELGAKLTRLGGRLHVQSALFHTWWRQMQTDQFADTGLPIIGNVGNARNLGAELELVYRPSPAWTLRANAAWNHSKLTDVTDTFGEGLGAETSRRLPGAPSFTGGLGFNYEWALSYNWSAMIGGDYLYSGKAHLLFDRENGQQADAFHLVDLRLGLRSDNWHVRLNFENLLDSRANSFAFGNPFSLAQIEQVTPLRPRTIGLELSWRF